MKRILFPILFILLLPSASKALDEIKIPYEFKKGAPARASEVNANFIALKKAIEALQEIIADRDTKIRFLEKENSSLESRIGVLEKEIDSLKAVFSEVTGSKERLSVGVTRFRSGAGVFSKDEIESMVKSKGFRDSQWNPNGDFPNEYDVQTVKGAKVVIDRATGLMWQQAGSSDAMTWENAQNYVKQLNRDRYARFADWRLPTIEELASLLEPTKKNGDLYIDPVFDARQRRCWSADKVASDASRLAWYVYFGGGLVSGAYVGSDVWVRVVRSR